MSGYTTVSAAELAKKLQTEKIFLADVREASEHKREHIADSHLFPSSNLNCQAILSAAGAGATVCAYCASGGRSSAACEQLSATIASTPAYKDVKLLNLNGGMSAWRMAGLPVVEDKKAPLPIIRQVHLIASTLIITGSVLALTRDRRFAFLPLFVGCGLFVSGSTGFCGMAMVLQHLPYNKA